MLFWAFSLARYPSVSLWNTGLVNWLYRPSFWKFTRVQLLILSRLRRGRDWQFAGIWLEAGGCSKVLCAAVSDTLHSITFLNLSKEVRWKIKRFYFCVGLAKRRGRMETEDYSEALNLAVPNIWYFIYLFAFRYPWWTEKTQISSSPSLFVGNKEQSGRPQWCLHSRFPIPYKNWIRGFSPFDFSLLCSPILQWLVTRSMFLLIK